MGPRLFVVEQYCAYISWAGSYDGIDAFDPLYLAQRLHERPDARGLSFQYYTFQTSIVVDVHMGRAYDGFAVNVLSGRQVLGNVRGMVAVHQGYAAVYLSAFLLPAFFGDVASHQLAYSV